MTTTTEALLSPEEVGVRLGVSVYTVRRWIKQGKLRAFRPGKEYRVRAADLEEFFAAREVHPPVLDEAPQIKREQLAAEGIDVNDTELATLNRLLAAYFELAQTGEEKTTMTIPHAGEPGTSVDMERIYLLVDYALASGILTPEDVRSLTQGMHAKLTMSK